MRFLPLLLWLVRTFGVPALAECLLMPHLRGPFRRPAGKRRGPSPRTILWRAVGGERGMASRVIVLSLLLLSLPLAALLIR